MNNVKGQGELETVLRAIKSKPSAYADCLNDWQNCLSRQGKTISPKDFDKFWVATYLKFDTCRNREKKQAGKYCSMGGFEHVMCEKSEIWNLDNPILDDLKRFLMMFY